MTQSNMTTRACLVSLGSLLAMLTSGCKQEPLCPALGECGGALTGSWVLQPGYPSCLEDLYVPPNDPRLFGGEVPSARTTVIEPAFFDWCLLLVTDSAPNIRRKTPMFYYESGPIGRANLTYTPDPAAPPGVQRGHFSIGLARTGTYTLDFPALCMRQFGAMDGRQALDESSMPFGDPTDVCKQLEPQLRKDGIGEGSYPNVTCIQHPDDPGGCLCAFDVSETGGPSGQYQVLDDGKTVMHMPATNLNFPYEATFCNLGGSSLELTGANGSYLFGQKGLRTLKLAPGAAADPCADGMMNGDELGIDCGGSCPTACP